MLTQTQVYRILDHIDQQQLYNERLTLEVANLKAEVVRLQAQPARHKHTTKGSK